MALSLAWSKVRPQNIPGRKQWVLICIKNVKEEQRKLIQANQSGILICYRWVASLHSSNTKLSTTSYALCSRISRHYCLRLNNDSFVLHILSNYESCAASTSVQKCLPLFLPIKKNTFRDINLSKHHKTVPLRKWRGTQGPLVSPDTG